MSEMISFPARSCEKKDFIAYFKIRKILLNFRTRNNSSKSKDQYEKLYHLTNFYLNHLEQIEIIDDNKYLEMVELNALHRMLDLAHGLIKEKDRDEKDRILKQLDQSLNDKIVYLKNAYGYISIEETPYGQFKKYIKELNELLSKLPSVKKQIEEQKKDIPNKIDERLINTDLYNQEYSNFISNYDSLITAVNYLEQLIFIVDERIKKANSETELEYIKRKVLRVSEHFNKIMELSTMPITDIAGRFKLQEATLLAKVLKGELEINKEVKLKKA